MKIKVTVGTWKIGSEMDDVLEIDDSELEGMTEQEIEDYLEDVAREAMFNMIEWSFERI